MQSGTRFRVRGSTQYAVLALKSSPYARSGLVLALVAFPLVFAPREIALAVGVFAATLGVGFWLFSFVRGQQALAELLLQSTTISDDALAGLTEIAGRAIVRSETGRMLVGSADGARIALAQRVELLASPYRLPPQLEDTKAKVIGLFRSSGEDVVNNELLVLDCPARSLDLARETDPVRVMRCRWFDFKVSADMSSRVLVTRSGRVLSDVAHEFLLDAEGKLRDPSHTRLANAIGVSTVAVTVDGAVLGVRQSARNSASVGTLAPSGSGSLEPKDWSKDVTLADLVVAGAERELREESLVAADEIIETRVIGWGRWLDRGGKPEFFSVTLLNASSSTIAARHHKSLERRHTHGAPIPMFGTPARPVSAWSQALELVAALQPTAEPWSLPLRCSVALARTESLATERKPT